MIYANVQKELHGAHGKMDLDVEFGIEEGAFVALTGESGSGKTTLLRIIAGLEEAKGEIKAGNEVWLSGRTVLPVQKRKIGFVFQDYALFENMSVEENLLFVNNNKTLAKHLLAMTKLEDLKKRYPKHLSGGQKQRVALCRAMMRQPRVLLLDEPLSALDPAMRYMLQDEIKALHKEFGMTTVMVSHDPSEIYRLVSYVIELNHGKIVREGTPKEILLKTQGSQKFSFIGEIIDIVKADVIYIAVVAIGQQLSEVVITAEEAESLRVGMQVSVSAKAFSPSIKPL